MRVFNLKSVLVFKQKMKVKPEYRIHIKAGSGYGPQSLTPAEAVKLGKALIKMGKA